MSVCKFCSKDFQRPSGLALHEKSCEQNPNRVSGQNQYTKHGVKMNESTRLKLVEAGKRQTCSQETRDKISKSRIRYLKEHPDQVPYLLNHSRKGESFPEKYWREILTVAGIDFEQERQVSIYRLDFAIGNLDLEIDGEQHYLDKRILSSNRRRDEELRAQGWKIIRVRWSSFQKLSPKDKQLFVSGILDEIRQTVNQ